MRSLYLSICMVFQLAYMQMMLLIFPLLHGIRVCVLYTMNSAYFYNVAFCHPLTEPNESRYRTERIGLALGGIWHLEAPTNNIMHWQTELKKKRNAEYSCSISSTAHRYMCVI